MYFSVQSMHTYMYMYMHVVPQSIIIVCVIPAGIDVWKWTLTFVWHWEVSAMCLYTVLSLLLASKLLSAWALLASLYLLYMHVHVVFHFLRCVCVFECESACVHVRRRPFVGFVLASSVSVHLAIVSLFILWCPSLSDVLLFSPFHTQLHVCMFQCLRTHVRVTMVTEVCVYFEVLRYILVCLHC